MKEGYVLMFLKKVYKKPVVALHVTELQYTIITTCNMTYCSIATLFGV
jgi:hypothetical protein